MGVGAGWLYMCHTSTFLKRPTSSFYKGGSRAGQLSGSSALTQLTATGGRADTRVGPQPPSLLPTAPH